MRDNLIAARELRGLSQSQLADLTGISRQALSAIETGKQDPSLKTALSIAKVLERSIDDLFGAKVNVNFDAREQPKHLSKTERLTLVNQYQILKRLSPNKSEAEYYDRLTNVFLYGYESLYHEAFDAIWTELPADVAEETLAILDLHRAMLWSLGESPSTQDIELVKFRGFDGNHESQYLAFARFYTSDGAYQELNIANSHHQTLNRYNKMLAKWDELGRPHQLTKLQSDEIIHAGAYKPQQR